MLIWFPRIYLRPLLAADSDWRHFGRAVEVGCYDDMIGFASPATSRLEESQFAVEASTLVLPNQPSLISASFTFDLNCFTILKVVMYYLCKMTFLTRTPLIDVCGKQQEDDNDICIPLTPQSAISKLLHTISVHEQPMSYCMFQDASAPSPFVFIMSDVV